MTSVNLVILVSSLYFFPDSHAYKPILLNHRQPSITVSHEYNKNKRFWLLYECKKVLEIESWASERIGAFPLKASKCLHRSLMQRMFKSDLLEAADNVSNRGAF